ncbi:MAG TPA: hypothetical protein VLK84_22305 [Longimicrobium sp.]|nr:hypothetical protein [Longimicrobium sp.]
MPKKPRLLLLDAVAIVAAFRAGVWDHLVSAYEVVVSSVVMDEAHFYDDPGTGRRHPIDLAAMEAAGTIQGCEVSLAEVSALLARFDGTLSIHAGEAEALAYLASVDESVDIRFVTSDRAALYATALLDLGHRSMCLADVLRACGVSKRLEPQHETEYHRACIAHGTQMRIQGHGLARRRT